MPYTGKVHSTRMGKRSRRSSSKSSKRSKSSAASKSRDRKTRKIVDRAIARSTPLKYFETALYDENPPHPIQGGAAMYCLGYCVGGHRLWSGESGTAAAGPVLKYGGSGTFDMSALNCDRVFRRQLADSTQFLNVPSGPIIHPVFTKTKWLIERRANTSSAGAIYSNLPMYVRCIHLEVKGHLGTQVKTDPATDAFLDPMNKPVGVSATGFSKNDLVTFKANNIKYTVKDDFFFTLKIPMTRENGTEPTETNDNSFKILELEHDMGSSLQYSPTQPPNNDAASPQLPVSGSKQSFVLWHFQYMGDPAATAATRQSADEVRVTCTPTSAFRD